MKRLILLIVAGVFALSLAAAPEAGGWTYIQLADSVATDEANEFLVTPGWNPRNCGQVLVYFKAWDVDTTGGAAFPRFYFHQTLEGREDYYYYALENYAPSKSIKVMDEGDQSWYIRPCFGGDNLYRAPFYHFCGDSLTFEYIPRDADGLGYYSIYLWFDIE